MKVLIIEDNPTDSKLAGDLLESEMHKVVHVSSAEQAIYQLSLEPPDIIMLDLKLPGIDGLELIRRLKADVKFKKIPVLAITAYPLHWGQLDAEKAGCDGYITKPIDTRALVQKMTSLLERS